MITKKLLSTLNYFANNTNTILLYNVADKNNWVIKTVMIEHKDRMHESIHTKAGSFVVIKKEEITTHWNPIFNKKEDK